MVPNLTIFPLWSFICAPVCCAAGGCRQNCLLSSTLTLAAYPSGFHLEDNNNLFGSFSVSPRQLETSGELSRSEFQISIFTLDTILVTEDHPVEANLLWWDWLNPEWVLPALYWNALSVLKGCKWRFFQADCRAITLGKWSRRKFSQHNKKSHQNRRMCSDDKWIQ